MNLPSNYTLPHFIRLPNGIRINTNSIYSYSYCRESHGNVLEISIVPDKTYRFLERECTDLKEVVTKLDTILNVNSLINFGL